MEDWKVEVCKLQGQSSRHKRRLLESREIISLVLEHMRCPYVAFSCGKDSTVLAHMVLSLDKSIPLRFLSSGETRLVHNVDIVLDYFHRQGANIQEINIDRVFSEEWKDASWDKQRKAGRGDLEKLNAGDWDGVFMGLRIAESNRRKFSLVKHQTPDLPSFCYRYSGSKRENMIRCCPLAKWTTEDIGAYLIANELPWLEWYDYRGFEGRTTARLTGDAVRSNVLAWLKYHNPDKFYMLATRFPEFKWYV